ncbi:MAG TPA: glycosyltransferase family 39 protein [Patescibacteria group bacterium]|uniref:Glycosyltransferase RgtA/B/C/D-like domain-containing protein n=1 Tax=Candidatus Woesebacteria bacterium RBG_13_46_13 TaxID=1802479 RepID=A0A1F7X2P6_9BACT|nr:MAG: hypothetical protein A2Y68_00060 [Candidatus Woesebacteria bacterium RBG_13_46_13]HJX58961.1 glycosyltransferase family 39 protein [Patescibacteria group bacterium]
MIKKEYIALVLIVLGGLLVRLYKIGSPIADWHSWRQADTASVSRTYVEKGINLLYPQYQDVSSIQTGIQNPNGYRFVEFPVYNAAHAALVKLMPVFSLEVWGRLLSIFCSLASLVVIFLLGRRFISPLGGLMAAFFFAFIPYNIYFSRTILPEPMATMFGLFAILFFVYYIDSGKTAKLYLSGLFLSLAILVKPFTVFYAFPMVYLALQKYSLKDLIRNSKLAISMLIFADIVLVPLLAWRAWMSNYPVGIPFFSWAFNGDGIRFRPAFWRWIFAERLGRLILGIWGVLPFSLGVLKVVKKNLFIQVFLLGMLAYVSVIATANVRHDYYQIFVIPAVSLALASGAAYLIKTNEFSRLLSITVLGASILLMLGMGAYQVKEYYKINHPEIIEAGKALDEIAPKDALVVAPYNGDTAFLYQTGRWGWPAIDTSIENIIERGGDYYVSVNQGDADTQAIIKKYKTVVKTDRYLIVDLHKKI